MPAPPPGVLGGHEKQQQQQAALRQLSSCSSLPSLPSLCNGTVLRDELWQTNPETNISKVNTYNISAAEWLKVVSEVELSEHGDGPEKSVAAVALSGSLGSGGGGGGRARAVVVVASRVYTAHDDLKIRAWEIIRSSSVAVAGGGGGGGAGGVGFRLRLLASLPTTCDAILRSLAPGGYYEVRRHHHKLWIQHADAISALAVHPNVGRTDRGYLYSASWDRTIKVWRLRDFTCLQSVATAHDDAINALAVSCATSISTTSALLFSASADATIKVWACASKRPYLSLLHVLPPAHRSAINALAVIPSSAEGLPILYSAACDKAIVVWRTQSPASAFTMSASGALRGHRHAVLCLATVSVSGAGVICSGSADKTVRVWLRLPGDNLRHVCIALLTGQAAPVKCLLVCPVLVSVRRGAAHGSPSTLPTTTATVTGTAGTDVCSLFVYSASWEHVVKAWRVDLG